ncbi:MAG: hypothetical protein K6T71_02860 [Candidatus Bipolaricaulota bacterium]|nr:hypothetical protein [Candidatus Bipolaricaulota bacterium]
MEEERKLAATFPLFSGWYREAISDAEKQPIFEGFFKIAAALFQGLAGGPHPTTWGYLAIEGLIIVYDLIASTLHRRTNVFGQHQTSVYS